MILDGKPSVCLCVVGEELDTYPVGRGDKRWGSVVTTHLGLTQSTHAISIHDLHKVVLALGTVRSYDRNTV